MAPSSSSSTHPPEGEWPSPLGAGPVVSRHWLVPSAHSDELYHVWLRAADGRADWGCTCPKGQAGEECDDIRRCQGLFRHGLHGGSERMPFQLTKEESCTS